MHRALPLVLLFGCNPEKWEPRTVTDEGTVCVIGTVDEVADVQVELQECLSSSCDTEREGSCTAELSGSTITVSSTFSWETATGDVPCTEDCGTIVAECTVGPLAAGEYTVVHGSEEATITVPTSRDCEPL